MTSCGGVLQKQKRKFCRGWKLARMKRMQELEGPKAYHHQNHYHQNSNHHHNNYNYGSYQHHNNGYHYQQNGHTRSNHGNHFYRKPYKKQHNFNYNANYNNNYYRNGGYEYPHHHQSIVHAGQLPDPGHIPRPLTVMEDNVVHQFHPQLQQQQPPRCASDSSSSSVKSEPSSSCNDQDEQMPVSQAQILISTVPSNPGSTNSLNAIPSVSTEQYEITSEFYNATLTLSQAIWAKYLDNQQSLEIYQKKMELSRELFDLFKSTHAANYPRYSLQVVGSTKSGFGSLTSDVDMCLMIRRSEVDQRIEAVDRLHELQVSLQKLPYIKNIELIYAKVPILKFRDTSRNLDVDLNCNNSVGIRNTHLLYCYSQLDLRVKPLVLVTKLWAQFHGINDAKNMTISSYSLVLMVIHFLQFGCKEPVLPCLHQMYPDKFSPYVDVEKIVINEKIPPWDSHNNENLSELLINFLEYYAQKFDYARAAVSVRLGCHVPIKLCMQTKSYKNDQHQWKYLCVEEPFDLTNTARSVYDKEAFDKIRGVFFASWQRLLYTRTLESIFIPIPEKDARAIAARMAPVILR